jgi:hypothetical protein
MQHVPSGAPFNERGGRALGLVDLLAGRYPAFLFGWSVGHVLPVFHFHETTVARLEPAFEHLATNGYRTVTSDELARIVRDGRTPSPRSVMLAFDDAWASLWMVVGPLLKKYGLRAVTYAIPGRMMDAAQVRPTIDEGATDGDILAADHAANPFVTWPELRALASSGLVDVQSHTWSHSMIFCDEIVVGRAGEAFAREPLLNRPRLNVDDPPEFLDPAKPETRDTPLYPRRSRMSGARRFFPATATWETDDQRRRAIEHELSHARAVLQTQLSTRVNHVCLPWGVSGAETTAALERLGFSTAFANRLSGRYVVARGDHPFFLKRLNGRHVFALPGRGRRTFVTFA